MELTVVIDGVDLSAEPTLQDDFRNALSQVIIKPSCFSEILFSAVNNNRLRRVLASGNCTQVVALLGYADDSAAKVMRAPEFASALEESLKAASETFLKVVVINLEVRIGALPAITNMTSTSTSSDTH